ncbi:MAG: hypothetical protein MH204_06815, partial [Fimbriimonadaceae bacterium]|nr:hypothetical protein [Fimbriimonadaceae bacterium]
GRGGPMTMTATGASRASRASAILFKGLTGQTADRRKFELAAGSLDLKTGLLRADQMLVTDPRGGRLRLSQAEWNRSTDTLKGIRAQHEQGGRRIEAAEITVTGQRLTARGPVISGSGFRLTGASLESPDQGRTARIEGGARVSGSGWEAESATLTSAAEGSVVLTGNPLVRFTPRQGGTGEARALKITLQGRPEQATITLEGRTSARWNGPDLQLSATMDRLTAQVRGGDLRWTGLGNPAELSIPGETTQRARGIEMHMQPDGRVEVKMTGVTGEFSR